MAKKVLKVNDVSEPNLYREVFPIPNFHLLNSKEKRSLRIAGAGLGNRYDVSRRPAGKAPYTPEQVLRIYDLLHKIDGDTGLIRQCEFFLYSDRDRKAVRAL